MNYKVNWTAADGVFAVPDDVVDNYIQLANGKAVKVLLYIMRHKFVSSENAAEIAANLDKNISVEDVEDAFSYWEQVGVICRTDKAPLLNVKPKNDTILEQSAKEPENAETFVSSGISPKRSLERCTRMLTPKEIADRVNESKEVEFLFSGTETMLGKTLTNTEQRTLIWMHDYYDMGTDIILMIVDFCKSINRPSIAFIEKIAASWNEKGISTHEQAENEIHMLQKYYSLEGQVLSKLGLNRALTPTEKDFVNNWAAKEVSIELIEKAYEKTIAATGKVTFNYMNKIIESWYDKGVKTIADTERLDYARENERKNTEQQQDIPIDRREHSYNLDLLLERSMSSISKLNGGKV